MRFLLDANLSPLIAVHLNEEGHSTVHVREVGLCEATDDEILDAALADGRVVVSQDTDFTNLLFYRRARSPSLILLRNLPEVTAREIAQLIGDNLNQLEKPLEAGAIVSIVGDRLRVRRLPLGDEL